MPRIYKTTRYVLEQRSKFLQHDNPNNEYWGSLKYAMLFSIPNNATAYWTWLCSFSKDINRVPAPRILKTQVEVQMEEI